MNPLTRIGVNRITKGVVIVSTLVAAFVQLYLATRLINVPLGFGVAVAFVVAVAVGARWPGAASGVVLAASYLAPAAYVFWPGFENYPFEIVWSLPLLGLIVSGRGAWHWHLPTQWRWPLVTWALVVAASWPFVFLREVDFYLGILPLPGVANTSIGISPWEAVTAVTYWTLVHNVGLLWFDRLFAWCSGDESRFRKVIVAPLAIAITVSCAVGAYQAFVDLRFVNPHLWPHMNRASGTLGDANTFGMLCALLAAAGAVLARRSRAPWPVLAAVAGIAIATSGVLTSGSRTALITLGMTLAAAGVEGVLAWRRSANAGFSVKHIVPVLVGALTVVVVVVLVFRGSSVTSIVGRGSLGYIPGFGDIPITESARELLWERFGYGSAAVKMITDHPLAGTGVGTFHTLVHDFALRASGKELVPDNAQSWYRHHLAELGVLGSLPWMAWCVAFGMALFSRSAAVNRFPAGVLRGTLLGFGIVSLLGMAGQSLPVVLTFWTIAFWFTILKGTPVGATPAWPTAPWVATLALVALHATVTFKDARGDLRPRNRALSIGWDYRYGLGGIERDATGVPERRTSFNSRSLSISRVNGRVLKLAAWIDHPDGDEHPVHVRIWADSRLVYDGELKRSAAILQDVPATPGRTHMVIESEISRLFRPRDYGRSDPRVLGLSIRDWVWEEETKRP